MKRETQESIHDALAWVVSTPMYINWRSNQPFPGAGERKSRLRGPTIPDFATHKIWEAGDDVVNIDWVASAQTNMEELVLRQYHEPRDINVVIVADSGPTMNFGTTEVTKRQFVARLTASVLVSAEKTHDLVGLLPYPDLEEKFVVNPRPAKGVLRDILQKVIECGNEPEASAAGRSWGETLQSLFQRRPSVKAHFPRRSVSARSIHGMADALMRLPKKRSLVIVASDFLFLSEADKQALRSASRSHYIVCLGVHDIRERELPEGFGWYTLKDITSGAVQTVWLSDRNRRLYRANFEKLQASLREFFTDAKIHYNCFSTDDSALAQSEIRELFWMNR